MNTFNGLPAHALLVHFIVVLAPLTAVLAVVCAAWPTARKRLVWFVVGLAIVTVALTPLTTEAGEWLEHQVGGRRSCTHTPSWATRCSTSPSRYSLPQHSWP